VTAGSETSKQLDAGGFVIAHAWFPSGVTFSTHFHNRTVVGVVLGGQLSVDASMRSATCAQATVYVEPQGERHAHRLGRLGAQIVSLQPDPARIELFQPLSSALTQVSSFGHAGIASRGAQLARELSTMDPVTPIAAEALALEIVAMIGRSHAAPFHGGPPLWLLRAHELLRETFRQHLRIAEIAAAVDVHPARLVRGWSRYYRIPIGNYIRRMRLEWACERLRDSDDSLPAIALRAGFADQSHFTRAFKAYTGVSPGRYRKSFL